MTSFFDTFPICKEHMQYWELAITKLASSHPFLLIRQLSMIPAVFGNFLGGKVNYLSFEAFKAKKLLKKIAMLLNVLRLLTPYLWARQNQGVMQLLDLYMDFFLVYHYQARYKRTNAMLAPLLTVFVDLLDNWMKVDFKVAVVWIQSQKSGLT